MKKYETVDDVHKEELLYALGEAYDAMHSEYMYCPWCGTGHIGYNNDFHEDCCFWTKIRDLVHAEQGDRENKVG